MPTKFSGIFAVVASFATFLFGKLDPSLEILVVFVVMDFITGLLEGWYSGTLSSKIGYRGTIKKAGIMCVIIVANLMDTLTGQHLFRMPIVYFFIATEGLSILENLAEIGVPIPKILLDKLTQVQKNEIARMDNIDKKDILSNDEAPKK